MRHAPKGFTLIEVLIVMSIIVLLMAILVPQVGSVIRAVRIKDTERRISVLHQTVEDYYRAYSAYPPSTSPNSKMKATDQNSYPPYVYPDGTEADYVFAHGYNLAHPFGGKFLAYFLMGPNANGWHRPDNPRNTADPNYRNRFITAEWDVPAGLSEFLDTSPGGVRGDRAAAGSVAMKTPCFLDTFGARGTGGGLIGYIAANPRATGETKWRKDSRGNTNDALTWVYYENCGRDEAANRGKKNYSGNDHLARTLEACPYGFALISPGPNQRFGYSVYGKEIGGKRYLRWYADLASGITDDIANYPLR